MIINLVYKLYNNFHFAVFNLTYPGSVGFRNYFKEGLLPMFVLWETFWKECKNEVVTWLLDYTSFDWLIEWACLYFSSSKLVSIKNSFKSGLLLRILLEGYYLTILFNYLDTFNLAPEIPGSDSLYFKKQLSQIKTDLIKNASFTFNYSNSWTVKWG